jgi:transcriptional regulator with XRE-family HTH domain
VPAPERPDWVLDQRRQIGHRIARWRAARGWSVDELAGAAGIGRISLLRAEHGSRSTGLDVLLQLAGALDLTIGQLLDGDPAAGTGGASGGA